MIANVSITGTRAGMNQYQANCLTEFLTAEETRPYTIIHGGAQGVDSIVDMMAQQLNCHRVIYPAASGEKTDLEVVQFNRNIFLNATVMWPLPPLERDSLIAYCGDLLIGIPRTMEVELRSGTWATIRRAWKYGRATKILYPAPLVKGLYPAHVQDESWCRYHCSRCGDPLQGGDLIIANELRNWHVDCGREVESIYDPPPHTTQAFKFNSGHRRPIVT